MRFAASLQRILDRAYTVAGPGAVVGVYRDGVLVESAAVGLAELDRQQPLESGTPLEIASISKQLGAAAIVQLADDGIVDLDADLRDLVEEIHVEGVTLRHCLQHTSGLPDYLVLGSIAGVPIGAVCGYDTFLSTIAQVTELDFTPGTTISYSNTGYVLAAIAAERAAGRIWPEILAQRVFEPLGMRATSVDTYVGQRFSGAALSYRPDGTGFVVEGMGEGRPPDGERHTVGDGQVFTNLEDLAAWQGFLLDGRTLGPVLRERLLACSVLADGRRTSYGLGIRQLRVGGVDAYGHSGSIWGFRANSLTEPDSSVGVVVLANRADTDPEGLCWRALRWARDAPRLYGTWFAAGDLRAAEVVPRPDGGIDLDDGVETVGFRPEHGLFDELSWIGTDEHERVRLEDDRLVHVDGLGRQVRYERIAAASAPPATEVTGTYLATLPALRLEIATVGDALELHRAEEAPERLRHVTDHEGAHVYGFAGGLAIITPGTCQEPSDRTTAADLTSAVVRNPGLTTPSARTTGSPTTLTISTDGAIIRATREPPPT